MTRFRWLAAWLLLAAVITAIAVYDRTLLHFLGWDGQTSDNYAAWSGSVPAIETGLGMSTLITGMWRHVNCHEPRCWRAGKHKVDGTPWCTRHQENARAAVVATLADVVTRLDTLIGILGGDSAPPP